MRSSHMPSALEVTFDDPRAVATAGLVLAGVLSERLGLEGVVNEMIDLGERPGHFQPGRKVATLVHAMVAGAVCIDDAHMLRSGATAEVLGHKVMAPSTLGTFLRAFTFGHLRQFDKVTEELLRRAWALGAGPGQGPMTVDLDSTICGVYGDAKEGAAYGYTKVLGYHPLLGTRAETGEVLHLRMRKGSAGSGRGAERFCRELICRVRRCGHRGELVVRADSGFFSGRVVKALSDHGARYSITAPQNASVKKAIEAIRDDAWVEIPYTESGQAWVAETTYADWKRLIVRRTKLADPQPALFPTFRYHAFVTDRVGDAVELDKDHRAHATVELAIRDLKEGSGLSHLPSGRFSANGAWALCATLAHNLLRWVAVLGADHRGLLVAKTVRRQLLSIPGRLTRSARRRTLHLPLNWPWAHPWLSCFERIRALPLVT